MPCNCHSNRRVRGITLLETLIAMMVMSIGLLGLAALLPVGRYQLQQAFNLDNGATLGRAAFRKVQISGIVQPEKWLNVDATRCWAPKSVQTAMGSLTLSCFTLTAGIEPPRGPIVIDPLIVSTQSDQSSRQAVATFPYAIDILQPSTLRNLPRVGRVGLAAGTSATLSLMPLVAADRLCRGEDDPIFDSSNPAINVTGSFWDTSTGRNQVRQTVGQYSWLVTAVPNLNDASGWLQMPGNGPATQHWRVSVVVCFKRILSDLAIAPPRIPEERLCLIDFMVNRDGVEVLDHVRNTDARLRIAGVANEKEAEEWLNVKPGQWIAVTGLTKAYSSDPTNLQDVVLMEWYRVISVGRVMEDTGDNWIRSIRIAGREWPHDAVDADGGSYSDFSGNVPTAYCTMLDGVIGVYERNIVLNGKAPASN